MVALFEDLFYQRLIKLRTEKGVSARDMSLSIGQSPGYINSLENRNGFPSMQVFFYICEYLGVTPAKECDGNRQSSKSQSNMSSASQGNPGWRLSIATVTHLVDSYTSPFAEGWRFRRHSR